LIIIFVDSSMLLVRGAKLPQVRDQWYSLLVTRKVHYAC